MLFPGTVVKFMQIEERHLTKNQTSAGMKASVEERLVRAEQSRWGWKSHIPPLLTLPTPTIFAVWVPPHVQLRRCSSEGRFNM